MKTLSHICSWVFLPLLMPLYGLLIVMFSPYQKTIGTRYSLFEMSDPMKWRFFAVFAALSCVAPGVSYVFLHRFKIISTIDMENRKERFIPLLIMFVYGLLLLFLFYKVDHKNLLPLALYALPLSGVVVTGAFMVLTGFFKISMHAGGAGILSGFIWVHFSQNLGLGFFWLAWCLLASGLTIGARWHLNKHSAKDLLFGYTLAFGITAACSWTAFIILS